MSTYDDIIWMRPTFILFVPSSIFYLLFLLWFARRRRILAYECKPTEMLLLVGKMLLHVEMGEELFLFDFFFL